MAAPKGAFDSQFVIKPSNHFSCPRDVRKDDIAYFLFVEILNQNRLGI
jgi:hypothetical protein